MDLGSKGKKMGNRMIVTLPLNRQRRRDCRVMQVKTGTLEGLVNELE